jgi:hypothetical protein
MVRPNAFLPYNGQTSVFVITDLDGPAVLALSEIAAETRGIAAKGRAEIDIADVLVVGLSFVRDDVPDRHGNILGWPTEGPELKAQQKSIALALAGRALLVLH